jgi:hypothetical protein
MEKPRVFVCFKTVDLAAMQTLLEWDQDKEFDFVFEEALPKVTFHSEEGRRSRTS